MQFDPRSIAELVRHTRANNRALGVTGLLLFDGDWFCQLLEGEEQTVRNLVTAIARDTRHFGFRILHEGSRPEGPHFADWDVAFGHQGNGSVADLVRHSSGAQIAAYLRTLAPRGAVTDPRLD